MTTPAWAAPTNGMPGNLDSANTTVGINQFLGAHGVTPVYKGAQILTPSGAQSFTWTDYGNGTDVSQPFTMSGTALGRVEIPLQPNGNGADVLVSLYADSGGSPNLAAGAICSTMLPAEYLNQVCATNGIANAGPLATAANFTRYFTGGVTTTAYQPPSDGPGGVGGGNSATVSGNYLVLAGGSDTAGVTNIVYSIQYLGGGVIARGTSQPVLPNAANGAAISSTPTAVYVLGGLNASVVPTANVASAAWNSSTGVISSWSAQTALPVATTYGASAVWNSTYVYFLGGNTASSGVTSTSAVYVNTLNNGQFGSWAATTSLPQALTAPFAFVVGNWLVLLGGYVSNSSAPSSTVYYAQINTATGQLGTWQVGPSLPTAVNSYSPGWEIIATGDSIAVFCGQLTPSSFTQNVQILAWDAHGPASEWRSTVWPVGGTTTFHPLYADNGDGSFDVAVTNFGAGVYYYSKLLPVPVVSVPLPATGLSNGATYHVVMRQFSPTSASDYVAVGTLDGTPLPAAAVTNGRWASGSWTSVGSGRSVPMSVFDQTTGGPVLHTWEDPSTVDMAATGARWTSLLNNAQGLLFGALDVTMQPNVALNSNPTFTSGVSPWTWTGGVLTQSAAQTHGGFAFSGLLTPSGGTQAFASTEYLPITQTPWGSAQWLMATGWFYSPTGYASFSLNINWFDQAKNYLSTTFNTVALSAAAWKQATTYGQVPATAAYCTIAPTEPGAPTSSNLLYISNCYGLLTPETVGSLTSAATVNYGTAAWPPVGVTQLN